MWIMVARMRALATRVSNARIQRVDAVPGKVQPCAAKPLIVVRATKVVATLDADELAMMSAEAVGAIWADLAVMVHRLFDVYGAGRTTL